MENFDTLFRQGRTIMAIARMSCFIAAFVCIFGFTASAQNLEGGAYNPETDPDIDLFMGSWRESMPRHTHGSLIERDILTRGDSLDPPRKAAVLEYINRFAHATLPAGASTTPVTLVGEQEVYYVISGRGTVRWKDETAELYDGICFLVPAGLEFSMHTVSQDEPLEMYLISEPLTDGFTPVEDIVARSNHTVPFNSVVGHWSYREKDLILGHHGLSTLHAVITLTLDPMTIGHPHFHVRGTEEVWTTISGHNIAWLGKQLREQPPGTAYMIPPDGRTNHSNINENKDEQVVMLYFAVRRDLTR